MNKKYLLTKFELVKVNGMLSTKIKSKLFSLINKLKIFKTYQHIHTLITITYYLKIYIIYNYNVVENVDN